MRRLAAALLASVSLLSSAGCLLGPAYKRPAIDSPEAHRGQVAPATAASLADEPWWDFFGDDALKALVDEALRRNFDVRVAAARVEEFRARAGIARSELVPQVNYQGQVAHGRQSDFVSGKTDSPTGTVFQANLGLSWEIDLWGRIRRLSEAALAQYLSTEEARRGVLLSVVSQVAESYFRLRELDRRLEIARGTTEAFQGTFDLFNRQLGGGVASGLQVSRAEAALGTAAAAIPDLERQIVAEENLLSFLLGRNPGPILRGKALNEQPIPNDIPAGLPSSLLERRPDVRQAEQQLVAANANVGAAIASFFPVISLTAAFGGVSPEISTLFSSGKSWSIVGGLAGPLFEGGRLKNQLRVSRAIFDELAAQYEGTVRNAFGEVSTALVAHEKLAQVEEQQTRTVNAYREAVRLANIRYLAGLSSYVEVLDAQQQLFPAEIALAQTRSARLVNLVILYRALGGGWKLGDPVGSR
ncbi:MAG TPA: efflux transporter outer membrane subunit [Thermoanaerobaculia bacterium]|nr:efflux transporter outer membrane subunit [Thermoanaerobaculia bacterium]